MTRDPVDLDARRLASAQETEAGRRRCLNEFQRELVKLRRDQNKFAEQLSAAIAEFQAGGTQVRLKSSTHTSVTPHIAWATSSLQSATVVHDIQTPGPQLDLEPLRSPLLPLDPEAVDMSAAPTAVVYCEANFGRPDGKTANGLVRHSERYEILAVIDSECAGLDAGVVLDNKANGIPICRDLADAIGLVRDVPDCFIYGVAPSSGMLAAHERGVVLDAIGIGMDVVSGLHEFLSDDPVFVEASRKSGVQITDVRKPPEKSKLRPFTGRIRDVTCARIAVLGTDCAIGKRTTASILTRLLIDRGVNAVMIGTGQTGLMQGARYGVALDAIPSQFCAGELEAVIVDAFEREHPDVIIIEGQGALSHPAFCTSAFVLRGSQPDGVILQHAPGRVHRCDFEHMPMPTPQSEIHLIQAFCNTKVIGVAINHENMSNDEVDAAIAMYEGALGIPATDPLSGSLERLTDMVVAAYPELRAKLNVALQ